MKLIVNVPLSPASEFLRDDLARAWESGAPRLEALADSALSSWEQRSHAHRQAVETGKRLEQAHVGFRESCSAVVEALLELRARALDACEVEYLDAITAENLARVMGRVAREPPPDSLAEIHRVLSDREQILLADREALVVALAVHREARRLLRTANARFASRCDELHQAVRRHPAHSSRRAA